MFVIRKENSIQSRFHQKRNFKPLGAHLDKHLKKNYFFIAYSSIEGQKTNLLYQKKIKPPKKGCVGFGVLEEMNQSGAKHALVLTSTFDDKLMKCRILGHFYYKMYVHEVCDAIYFLRQTEPFNKL